MSTIRCYDSDGSIIDELYQWSSNVKVRISGIDLTDVASLHFCNRHSKTAIVVSGEKQNGMITTNIPNVLLQEPETIIIFICKKLLSGEFTTYGVCRIPVHPRPIPSDYAFVENIDYVSWADAQERINQLIELLESSGSGESGGSSGGSTVPLPDISGGDVSGVVLFDTEQNLSKTSRTTAKNNIGVYVHPSEPTDAKEGDIWFDTDDNDETEYVPTVPDETEQVLAYVTPNWDIHNLSIPGYVHGRPMWAIEGRETIMWDGTPTGVSISDEDITLYLISSSVPIGGDLVGATVRYIMSGTIYEKTVTKYCTTDRDITDAFENATDVNDVIAVSGMLAGYPTGSSVLFTCAGIPIAFIFNKYVAIAPSPGVYVLYGDGVPQLSELSYDYSTITVDSRYANIFKAPTASNVYVIDASGVSNDNLSSINFSEYVAGDVILLTNLGSALSM